MCEDQRPREARETEKIRTSHYKKKIGNKNFIYIRILLMVGECYYRISILFTQENKNSTLHEK
jgi:hypothetical protein